MDFIGGMFVGAIVGFLPLSFALRQTTMMKEVIEMTTEQAIYQLTDLIKDGESFCHRDDFDDVFLQDIEACKMGIQALEKQVPKKLINPKKISNRRCADCCYCKLTLPKPCRFCPRCGQALDWSDENE